MNPDLQSAGRITLAALALSLPLATPLHAAPADPALPTVLNPSAEVNPAARFDHAEWDAILRATVKDGLVDYLAIRRDHWASLNAYLNRIAKFDADTLPRDEKLALYINLYNATMTHTIVERFRVGYSCTENNKGIFKEPLVRVGNQTITLNHLEHQLIRAAFNEPRIHAALVCGGLGCPPLDSHAFTGPDLDRQLTAAMTTWATDNNRNRVDDANRTITLSKLFKSYAADFGGEDKAIATVDSFHPADFKAYTVTFDTNYDWTLNLAPPRAGKWVSFNADAVATVTQPAPGARAESATASVGEPAAAAPAGTAGKAGDIVEVLDEHGDALIVALPFGGQASVAKSAVTPYPPSAK